MNKYQLNLFTNLEVLVATNEAFYKQEFQLSDKKYWIYNYRLASYTDFLLPSALECRGIMFEIGTFGEAVKLASMPMHKFFNRFENPLTMDVDLSVIDAIEHKSDGSLISTFTCHGILCLKSKGSLFSDQAMAAMKWLEKNPRFETALRTYDIMGYTVNMEWISPDNRIVIGYLEPQLVVLNVRNRNTGEYLKLEKDDYLYQFTRNEVNLNGLTPQEFVDQIPTMLDDIEGFVIKTPSIWFKCKTNKYLSLHHCKDSVNSPRRLWEVIVNEGIDDVRSMFHTDTLLIKQIDEMQQKVDHAYNSMVQLIETFYNESKHLERKDYAIKGQHELPKLYFSLAMNLYLGKKNDYKAFLIKHYKEFGIKDEVKEVE